MKILLLYPPQWNPNSPYLALPLLAAQLKQQGYCANIRDINIEFYNHILTKANLESCLCKGQKIYEELDNNIKNKYPDALNRFSTFSITEQTMLLKFKRIQEILFGKISPKATVESVEDAVQVLKDKNDFYNPEVLFKAKRTIQEALKIASLPYLPNEIIYDNYFGNPLLELDWINIDNQCKDVNLNMFIDYYSQIIPEIANADNDLVCITVPDLSQLIPAFTLARMIKACGCSKIAIGGNYITQNEAEFINHPEIFDEYCDYLLIGDGETSIIQLAEYIDKKADIASVSNMIYVINGKVTKNNVNHKHSFENLAFPDFSDLDFSLYFSPQTILPIQLSKGCYWGKCTFCDYYFGQPNYCTKNINNVITEIKHYINKYNINHFLFIDEAIPPAYYNSLSKAIIENGLDIYFYSFVRLENGFTQDVLKAMHKAGFRMGLWGYEAYSKRIMKMMNKGIDIDNRERILQDSRAAGIWNNVLFIMGYPTETYEEIEKTIAFMFENRSFVNSCTPSNFSLKKNAVLMNFIGTNGLKGYKHNGEFYTVLKDDIDGIPQSERREIRRRFHTNYIEVNKHCLWPINYSESDHMLLYLAKYGCDYVANYRSEENICLNFR